MRDCTNMSFDYHQQRAGSAMECYFPDLSKYLTNEYGYYWTTEISHKLQRKLNSNIVTCYKYRALRPSDSLRTALGANFQAVRSVHAQDIPASLVPAMTLMKDWWRPWPSHSNIASVVEGETSIPPWLPCEPPRRFFRTHQHTSTAYKTWGCAQREYIAISHKPSISCVFISGAQHSFLSWWVLA